MRIFRTFTLLIATATAAVAEQPTAIDLDTIKVKVSVQPDEEFFVEFNRDGDRLANPSKSKQAEVRKLSVKVALGATSASPVRPPREGARRPFLSVENNFDETLQLRAIVRLKGRKEYFAIADGLQAVPAGSIMNQCWDFDTEVAEVVLYDFALVREPSPAKWVANRFGRPNPHSVYWSVQPEIVQNFEPSGIGAEIYRMGDYTLLHNTAVYWSHEEHQDVSHDMEASVMVFNGEKRVFVARGYHFDRFQANPKERTFFFRSWTGVMGPEQITEFNIDAAGDVLKVTTETKSSRAER